MNNIKVDLEHIRSDIEGNVFGGYLGEQCLWKYLFKRFSLGRQTYICAVILS
jgi:hypothetical protein